MGVSVVDAGIDTRGRRSFGGGVHPPEKKELTEESRISPGPAAKQVAIMLSQHTGAICEPLVNKGDVVEVGQKIGDSSAFVSAPVHSPVKGKVKETALGSHAVLGRSMAVVIDADADSPAKHPSNERFGSDFDEDLYRFTRSPPIYSSVMSSLVK